MVTLTPRHLKLFAPSEGGNVTFEDIGEALEIGGDGLPNAGEHLKVTFKQPDGSTGIKRFYNNFDIFLEDNGSSPPNNHPISNIPDDQLLACCSMAAILAGEVHPGTKEFLDQIASDQNNKNFQTILGDCKLKSVTIVDEADLNVGESPGNFYNVEFQRKGQGGNTKTVKADVINISKYQNRANNYSLAACCAPGALTEEFGKLITSDLGDESSQIRQDIITFLKNQRFYA